jgi:hypothetical protein
VPRHATSSAGGPIFDQGVFDGIFILQGWNRKNLFYRGKTGTRYITGGKIALTPNMNMENSVDINLHGDMNSYVGK